MADQESRSAGRVQPCGEKQCGRDSEGRNQDVATCYAAHGGATELAAVDVAAKAHARARKNFVLNVAAKFVLGMALGKIPHSVHKDIDGALGAIDAVRPR